MPGLKRIRLKKVSRVALLTEGANLTRGLYKASGATELTITPLAKSLTNEQGLMYSIVYAPNLVDSHGHFMESEDTKRGCHSFAQAGMALDLFHGKEPLAKEKVYVAENFMLTGPDDRFPKQDNEGREIQHDGAWATITHFVDPELRKQAREGKLGEVSLYAAVGDYELEDVAESDLPSALKKSSDQDTDDMKPEELKQVLDANNTGMAKMIADALAPLVKALEPKTETPPKDEQKKDESKFDPTDPKDLVKMQFNADMNDLYDEFDIDPAKASEGVALLKGADLKNYTERVAALREEHGLVKSGKRAGGAGTVGTGLKKGTTESNESGDFESWDQHFKKSPLTKARQEREKAGK